uniref:ShKT domain-containing protein n=1 Tax=Dracunculus medinensis TaxID=318479 RepID=A0A0N4USB9_DRAME
LDLCTNPQTAAAALERCPNRCGVCNRPDLVTNCAQLLLLLICTNPYMQANCMRSCNITTLDLLKYETTEGGSLSCMDSRANCAQMSPFCNVSPYSYERAV